MCNERELVISKDGKEIARIKIKSGVLNNITDDDSDGLMDYLEEYADK